MGKLIFDDRDGYSFISDNGVEYDLLEGRSLKGETTSDIVFVMLAYNEELFEYLGDNRLPDEFLGYFFGAAYVRENDKDTIHYIEEYVAEFEKNHPEIVEFYKPKKKKYKITIEATSIGYVEVEAENIDEAIELSEAIESDKIDWDDGEYSDRVVKVEEI